MSPGAFGVRLATLAVLAALAAAPAHAADPVGFDSVEGKNPGHDGTYCGTVIVTRTGDTFRVFHGTRIIGTGSATIICSQ